MTAPEFGKALRARIRLLCDEFTQSEVARRTGTPISSVHRYVSGARVPAEFCADIVRGLGVNPAWLLVGEGSRMLADVPARTAAVADGMVEMVEAMNAVENMRLGSLTGKGHRKTLRALNDALQHHESLRVKLDSHIAPVARELTQMLNHAAAKGELSRARDLHNSLKQVIRFTEAPDLHRSFADASGHLEYVSGNPNAAADIQRRVFMMTLADPDAPVSGILTEGRKLATVLAGLGRHVESAAIVRSALAVCSAREPLEESGELMSGMLGKHLLEIGELDEGVRRVAVAIAKVRGHTRQVFVEAWTLTLRYQVEGRPPSQVLPQTSSHASSRSGHLIAALLTGEAAELRFVLEAIRSSAKEFNAADAFLMAQADFVYRHTRKRRGKTPEPDASEVRLSEPDQVALAVYAATRARLKGDGPEARRQITHALQLEAALGRHSCVPVMARCLLYREALQCLSGTPQAQAAQLALRELSDQGYGCTRWAMDASSRE